MWGTHTKDVPHPLICKDTLHVCVPATSKVGIARGEPLATVRGHSNLTPQSVTYSVRRRNVCAATSIVVVLWRERQIKDHQPHVEEKASSAVPFWKKAINGPPGTSSWISCSWGNLQHFGGSSPWNQQQRQHLLCLKCHPVPLQSSNIQRCLL